MINKLVSSNAVIAKIISDLNLKENDYGNSLQNQVQALRGAVRAPHATAVRRTAGVRGMRRICRNRNGDPLPGLPQETQHHAGRVQRTDRGDLHVGLNGTRRTRQSNKKVGPEG